jgi:hypothetical protein
MVIVNIAYPQQSASAAKQNTTFIVLALLVLFDVMNTMLSTVLRKKSFVATMTEFSHAKNLAKWGPLSCLFLCNLFSNLLKMSCHLYSM